MKYDQFELGQTYITESKTVTRDDIFRFAQEYDPLYLHLDDERAEASRFGGIIASGIQVLAITTRLLVGLDLYSDDVIAGTGMDQVRFCRPVYPGDTLQATIRIVDKIAKDESAGKVTFVMETHNDAGDVVFSGTVSALFKR